LLAASGAAGWLAGVLACSVARTPVPNPDPGSIRSRAPAVALDGDGVQMLYPSTPGSSFRLGSQDPNHADRFLIEHEIAAKAMTDGPLRYWNTVAYDLAYASGGTGRTSRLHIYASGGRQAFTWKTQTGFLSSPADVRNQELTAYVRVHDIFDPSRAAVTLKVRGGRHTEADGDLASCVMMTLGPGVKGVVTRFGKELIHPKYDYVTLSPRFPAALADGRWVGLKMVSYAAASEAGQVVNRLYLDTEPWGAGGQPANHWRLFSEYVDVEGKSTGRYYSKLVDWGGFQTTIRTDGVAELDFTLVSVREIQPPR